MSTVSAFNGFRQLRKVVRHTDRMRLLKQSRSFHINIEPCARKDLPVLRRLAELTFVESFGAMNKPENMTAYANLAFSEPNMLTELENPCSHFYFAKNDSQAVAYLKLSFDPSNLTAGLEIERIYVLSSHQGQAIGSELFNFAWNFAVQNDCPHVWLGVWDQNLGAIRFYERHGFESFGQKSFFLGEEEQADILMKRKVVS